MQRESDERAQPQQVEHTDASECHPAYYQQQDKLFGYGKRKAFGGGGALENESESRKALANVGGVSGSPRAHSDNLFEIVKNKQQRQKPDVMVHIILFKWLPITALCGRYKSAATDFSHHIVTAFFCFKRTKTENGLQRIFLCHLSAFKLSSIAKTHIEGLFLLAIFSATVMKKRFAILLSGLMAMTCGTISAQSTDSLLNLLSATRDADRRAGIYTRLSESCIGGDDSKSEIYFNNAVSLYLKAKNYGMVFDIIQNRIALCDSLGRIDLIVKTIDGQQQAMEETEMYSEAGKVYNHASFAMIDAEDYELAAVCLMRSQAMSEAAGDTVSLIRDAFNLGYCYSMIHDEKKAIEYFKETERLTILCGDSKGLIDIYMNIGTAYEHLNIIDTALAYHFKSLDYCNRNNDKSLLWMIYYNVAFAYFDDNNYSEALDYCRRSLSAEEVENSEWPKDYAMLNSLKAEIFIKTANPDSVIACLQQCLKYNRQKNDRRSESESLCRIADAYRTAGNYRQALDFYNQSLNLSRSANLLAQQRDALKGLASLYTDRHNLTLAYDAMSAACQITDSLLKIEKEQGEKSLTQQLQARERIMLIEHEIAQNQQKQQYENERQAARHRTLILSLAILSVIVTVVVVVLMHVRHINSLLKKANNEINTQKTQLEEASLKVRRRYRFLDLLINTVPTPLFFVRKDDHTVVGCNEAFEQLCGVPRDAIMHATLDNLRKMTGIDWYPDKTRDFGTVSRMRFADGRQRDVICYISEITDEGGYGDLASLVIVDVTELENVRRELCESQKNLEDALNVKTKFFSIFAHDLKNPFNGILGMTSLLAEYYENYTADEVKRYLKVINDSATHVYNMLTNLLDWAKSQTGMLEVSPSSFCITEPINEAIAVNSYNIDFKQIKIDLQIEYDYTVVADKNMVFTIFRNLIGNALKYTPTGGRITITVNDGGSDYAWIAISDTGIGISPENQKRLFKANHPITTPGLADEKGSGLGLIICHEFVRRNGGNISVVSEVGKGTTFVFNLKKA